VLCARTHKHARTHRTHVHSIARIIARIKRDTPKEAEEKIITLRHLRAHRARTFLRTTICRCRGREGGGFPPRNILPRRNTARERFQASEFRSRFAISEIRSLSRDCPIVLTRVMLLRRFAPAQTIQIVRSRPDRHPNGRNFRRGDLRRGRLENNAAG